MNNNGTIASKIINCLFICLALCHNPVFYLLKYVVSGQIRINNGYKKFKATPHDSRK